MTIQSQVKPSVASTETEHQVVALHLGDEIYGIDIAAIHTVITPQAITAVPRTPPFVVGVINLRGRIVPVVDLRKRFALPPAVGEQKGRRIVIVETEGLTAGLIVDAVSEVLRLPESAIDPPSSLVVSADIACILGIGRIPSGRRADDTDSERLILLLDVYQTLVTSSEEADALHGLQRAA
jgi:purine-binding chemotaxis protein CheW